MLKDILARNDAAEAGQKEMAALRQYFPQCFKADGTFDLEAFKAALPGGMTLTDETSGFNWLGRNYARMLTNMDTTTLLVPDEAHNSEPENRHSHNVYISGNNLDALQHLVKSYGGRIKVIYIDPPYNTGSDGFVYNDKFNFTAEDLARRLDISMEEANHILSMTRRGSASHAAWLTFMLPRLTFARDLLADDGVIFISIDDNEQANLKELCDEIFGEENFVAQFIWISKTGGGSDNANVVADHEYVLCYCRNSNFENAISKILVESEELDKKDDYGKYRLGRELNKWGSNSRREDRPTMYFPIPGPNGEDVYPIRNDGSEGCWRWGKKAMSDAVKNHNVEFVQRDNGTYIVYEKIRTSDPRQKPYRTFLKDTGTTADGTKQIKAIFGKKVFTYPKPIQLIKILLCMGLEDGDLFVDFFGGSSTSAHAVLELNDEKGIDINYILVQIPEVCKPDSEAFKSGYKTIDELGMERIRRAAKKIKADNPLFAGDLGFKHYTLEEPKEDVLQEVIDFDPQQAVTDLTIDDFGRGAVLRTFMEADGYGLTDEPEEVMLGRYKAYYIGDHLYLLNPDNDFDADSLVALMDKYNGEMFSPHNIVVFGYSFGFVNREALQKNLRTLREGNKTLNVNLDIRY
jgi:type III restriction enzyme/adenine-specific DNA-methyltransferase